MNGLYIHKIADELFKKNYVWYMNEIEQNIYDAIVISRKGEVDARKGQAIFDTEIDTTPLIMLYNRFRMNRERAIESAIRYLDAGDNESAKQDIEYVKCYDKLMLKVSYGIFEKVYAEPIEHCIS